MINKAAEVFYNLTIDGKCPKNNKDKANVSVE